MSNLTFNPELPAPKPKTYSGDVFIHQTKIGKIYYSVDEAQHKFAASENFSGFTYKAKYLVELADALKAADQMAGVTLK